MYNQALHEEVKQQFKFSIQDFYFCANKTCYK
mgnify:FL=1